MRNILLVLAIFILSVTNIFSQLSGIYTVGSGGDYPTIADAVTALNTQGVADPGVTFNVLAGHVENVTAPITITATGTSTAPIVFQKSGSGANPVINRTDAGTLSTSTIGGAGDAIIRLEGTDYITFDGIDVYASNQGIEYGYLTHKPSGTDGCQDVTIKNCTITMTKGTSGYVVGIYIGNGTTSTSSATGVTVTANSGKNQNITIIGNTITNVHAGIYVRGSSATGFYDSDVTIGQQGAGNTITNFGGGSATTTYGVYFIYVNNPTVAYNTITSATHGSSLYGIFYSTVTGNVVGSNNTFTLANNSTSSATQFIYNGNSVTSENFSNNTFAAGTLSSTGNVYLIYSSNATPNKTISNNTISGTINRSSSSGSFYCYYNFGSPSSGTETIQNNNFSNITLSGSSGFYGIYTYTASNHNRVCSDNTVSNITGGTGSTYLIYALSTNSNQVYNNNVYGITAGGTVYGIYFSGTNPTVYGNNIYNITTSGSILYGLYNAGTGTTNCYKNQIYNLTSNNTNATLYGIYITTGTSNYVYNNFVSDLKTPSSGSTTGLAGIYVSGGTTIGLYYNTVYLNATSTGADFGSSAIYASTTPTLDMRNNIFVNISTPNGSGYTVAYRRSNTTLTTYSSNSNNNLFYAGTPSSNNLIFYDGTNSDQTISAFKTRVSPRDAASFSENPPFVDVSSTPYDLHIDAGTPTQIESGGTPISSPITINTDFDGDARNASTPDVGADEFNGTGLDLTPPSITYTPLSNSIVAATRTFSNVVITDPSGVDVSSGTKPRVYYKKSTDPNDETGWVYVEADNSSSPFNFTIDYSLLNDASVSVGDIIQYFVVAQDLASTPNVGINSGTFANPQSSVNLQSDAFPIGGSINSYAIVGTISGNVTVGSGGNYSSLTGTGGLFDDINNKVVTGNIVATIISDLTEDGTNALNQMATEGGNWTLTIQPDAATVRTISGNYAGGLIRLNGADRVTIDGRYNGSGNYLTFRNTNTNTNHMVIQLISLGTGQGCENVTIRNCTIETGSSSVNSIGIHAGGTAFETNGADHDNLSIIDNIVNVASYGILVFGSASTSSGGADDLTITGNSVTCNTSVQSIGIRVRNALNATISGNELDIQQSSSNAPVGISLETGVNNTTVSRNLVKRVAYTGTGGYGGRGIVVGTGLTSSNITLVNNVVYGVTGDNYSSFGNSSSMGIAIGVDGSTSTLSTTTGGVNIYYNSVNMYGTYNRATACITTALYVGSGASNLDIRNNIFVNSMDNTGTASKSYAIYSVANASAFTTINNNDYYAPSPEGILGYLASDITTLSDWRTATGQDGSSIEDNPMFTGDTDLRPASGSPVLGAGTPISGITTDFLGDPRDATSPSIGAYENQFIPSTPPNCPVLISPANASTRVSVQPTLQWSDGGGGTTGYKLYFGTDNPPTNIHNGTDLGNVTSYTFSSNLNYLTTYYWRIVSYNNNGDASGCEVRSFTTDADPALLPSHVTFDPAEFPPFGWTANPSSGTGAWKRSTSGTNPSTTPKSGAGMGFFNSFFYSSGTSGLLISPQINFPDENFRVYFWMYRDGGYTTNADRLDIYVSTTTDTADGALIGTVNRSTTLPPSVSGNGWYFYEFNLPTGTSGNRYIIVCGRSAYGNNIYIDELGISAIPAATNTQTISAGNTDPITFTGTGATIQFTVANTGSVELSVQKINSSPGGSSALPSGVQNLAPVYWNIQVTSGTVNGTYSLTLDVSGVPGVNNPSTVRLLKRSNPNEPWSDLGVPSSINGTQLTWTGLTSFSDFGFGGGGDNPLPVQLSSFTATTKGRDVILNWTTATEINTAGFEIERKLVSQEKAQAKWENVGFVRGNGNSNRPIEYTFTDTKLNTGKYAYRLRMIDNDGSYEYSDEVQVEIGKPDVTKIEQNYPNAFNPATKIEYQLANPSKVVIEVYNITGEKIAELVNSEQVEGYYSLVFDASKYGLASGIYFYRMIAMDRVTGKNVVQTKKMLYLK